MRKPFVAGNWKMNTTSSEASLLVTELKSLVDDLNGVDIAVCPPFPYLAMTVNILKNSPIQVGSQNIYYEEKGAYTGEVAASMIQDIGCTSVILGHSERRHIFGETDQIVYKKIKKALDQDLSPIVCIGETLEQREGSETVEVIETQLKGCFSDLSAPEMKKITIAYEPVWAIGTGRTATPEQAQEVHQQIRNWLRSQFESDIVDGLRIQYGGSVKPGNARDLMKQPDIDGALVGGASLKAEDFAAIIKAAI